MSFPSPTPGNHERLVLHDIAPRKQPFLSIIINCTLSLSLHLYFQWPDCHWKYHLHFILSSKSTVFGFLDLTTLIWMFFLCFVHKLYQQLNYIDSFFNFVLGSILFSPG